MVGFGVDRVDKKEKQTLKIFANSFSDLICET